MTYNPETVIIIDFSEYIIVALFAYNLCFTEHSAGHIMVIK